jgi:hypothetical protein
VVVGVEKGGPPHVRLRPLGGHQTGN